MGRASRKKREAKLEPQAPKLTIPDSMQALRDKLWSRDALKKLIPADEEPIATRYDPSSDSIHIACASGKVHSVARRAIEAAEEGPRVVEIPLPERNFRMEDMVRVFEEHQRQNRLPPPFHLPPPFPPPLPPEQQQRNAACAAWDEYDNGRVDEPIRHFDKMWEMAEARYAEARIANAVALECFKCDLPTAIVMLKATVPPLSDGYGYCEPCALRLILNNPERLDWDADA